jgi:hypothetical protein
MRTLDLTAVFRTFQQLQQARENLLRLGIEPGVIAVPVASIRQEHALTVRVDSSMEMEARDALITAGSVHVSARGQQGANWMSHNNGRVTGAGVTPGAGDSEAGTSGTGPREI